MDLVKNKSDDRDETYTIDLDDNMSLTIDKKSKGTSFIMDVNEILILKLPNVTSFRLWNAILTDIGCILLRDALIKNTTIIDIDIDCDSINDIQAIILSDIVNSDYITKGKGNKTITKFEIYIKGDDCAISKIGIKALLQALNKNNFIEDFSLSKPAPLEHICDIEEVDLLSNIIETNDKLLNLNVSKIINFSECSNSLINKDIILNRFSNSLKNNKTLLSLELNHCFPDKIILNGLQNNISIKRLHLRSNTFNTKEIESLANILKFNKTLEYVELSDSLFINDLKKFMEELQNSTIVEIEIDEDIHTKLFEELNNWYSDVIYIDEFTGIPINNSDIESMLILLCECNYIHCNTFTKFLLNLNTDWMKRLSNEDKSIINNKIVLLDKYANIMDNNINLYNNAFWNPREHLFFRNVSIDDNKCHQLVMTSLICNSYLRYNLSIYVWQYIFSFYQKKQFHYIS